MMPGDEGGAYIRRALPVGLEIISDSRVQARTGWIRYRTRTAENIGESGVNAVFWRDRLLGRR
jgi:hypothetical protein